LDCSELARSLSGGGISLIFNLKSRDGKFYELFREGSETVCKGVSILREALEELESLPARLEELTAIEQVGDALTRSILERLNQTLVTPFDREDIYMLARELDRILDHVHGTLEKMVLYKTGTPTEEAKDLVRILENATDEIRKCFELLDDLKNNYTQVLDLCEDIKYHENQGDHRYRKAVADLFEFGTDPIEVIKWKEVYEHLETALDHCEDVANLLKGVALKYV
jgi:predicted phosphate transport protein (TIGR00153 family)